MIRSVSAEALKPRWREFRLRFHLLNRNLLVRVALIVIAAEIVIAILAPYIAPHPESIQGIATRP